MKNDLNKAAENYVFSGALDGKQRSIENAAASPAGQRVRAMLDANGFDSAVKSGDTEALRRALSSVLNTSDGAALMQELSKIMKK